MRRKLLNLATALSLVLPCAVAVLWVRSYWTADVAGVVRQVPTPHSRLVWSANGDVTYRHQASPPGSKAVYQSPGWIYGHGPANARDDFVFFGSNVHRFLGVTYADNVWKSSRGDPLNGEREILVRVPYWLLLAATGALPIKRLLLRRRRRRAARAAAGLCAVCGYDLRASPDRCPECGTVREATPATAA
jgi:hypothetical protein